MQRPRGLQLSINASGTYQRIGEAPRPLSLAVQIRADPLLAYLRGHSITVTGTLDAKGLADHVPVTGKLLLSPVSQKLLDYELDFTDDTGHPCCLHGRRSLHPSRLLRTFLELPGDIRDPGGNHMARCHLKVHLRALVLGPGRNWRILWASKPDERP